MSNNYSTLPLQTLKIVDFSTLLPGPYGSMLLADLGADVLHIESPSRPDLARLTPPFVGKESTLHSYINRNKKSITLDLKQTAAIDTIKQLIMEYDIVIEQFRPGVMTRLGLDYNQLKELNPALIYCSITGYGQTSPYQQRAGHDINYLALAGIADASRRKGQPPVPQSIQVADVAGGSLHGVIGILAAVIARQATGEGQHIDISMADCAFALNALAGSGFLAAGVEPKPEQQVLNGGSYYDYYQTRDGFFLAVGCLEPTFLQHFCQTIDKQEWMSLASNPQPDAQQQFKVMLTDMFLTQDLAYWQQLFADTDVCVEPVLTFAEACEHPHFQSRQMIVEIKSQTGTQQQLACPIKFSHSKPQYQHAGRHLGSDNRWLADKQKVD